MEIVDSKEFPTMIIYGVSRQRHWTRRRFMIATESFDVNFQVSNGIERLPFIFLWNKNHTKLFLDNEEKWTGKKKTNWFTQSLLGSQKLRVPVGESEQDLKTSSFLFFDWCRPSSNSHLKAYQLVFSYDKVGTLVMMSDEVIALYLSTYGRFRSRTFCILVIGRF